MKNYKIMEHVRKYEKEYSIKILLLVEQIKCETGKTQILTWK